ncbi:MAG: tetratricopeptide repeat protein [Pseudomonadales bacterium]|nr:tetratricopeptide repeat protein [Pseudomonadales bacterium]
METALEPPFIGESRKRIVAEMLQQLQQVQVHSKAHLISLEATTGWGKTRLARELYKVLAARQHSAYWPASILEASHGEFLQKPNSRRKRVFPQGDLFSRNSGALPEFMWLGLTCSVLEGEAQSPFESALNQLDAHKLYLGYAWARHAGLGKTLARKFNQGAVQENLADEGIDTATESLIEILSDSGVPGVGSIRKSLASGFKQWLHTSAEKDLIQMGGTLDNSSATQRFIGEVAAAISAYALPQLPMIVFIEDFHHATEELKAFVIELVKKDLPILIITSAWPHPDMDNYFSHGFTPFYLEDRISRLRIQDRLSNLSTQDLQQFILWYFPETPTQTLMQLSQRIQNPLVLELLFTLPDYAEQRDGPLTLYEDLEVLPDDVQSMYQRQWDAMDDHSKRYLVLAYLASPQEVNAWHLPSTHQSILNAIRDQVCENGRLPSPDQVPYGWAKALSDWLATFGESDYLATIKDAQQKFKVLSRPSTQRFLDDLALQISNTDFNGKDCSNDITAHLARVALALNSIEQLPVLKTIEAIRYLTRHLIWQPLKQREILALGERALALAQAVPKGVSDKVEDQIIKVYLMDIRSDMAMILGESGDLVNALAALEKLLPDQEQVLGSEHQNTLATRSNIAMWRGKSGDAMGALSAHESLLPLLIQAQGKDHLSTLRLRSNITYWREYSGDVQGALLEAKSLLQDLEKVLGKDHWETFNVRNNIAVWSGKLGDLAGALRGSESLLQDQQRVMGSDHMQVLNTRNNIAFLLGCSGDVVGALNGFKALSLQQEWVLGKDHPTTLNTYHNIAFWLGRTGDLAAAIAAFDVLIAKKERILGEEHPETLLAHNHRALMRSDSGDLCGGLVDLKAQLPKQERLLGPDHPDTLRTRNSIAYFKGLSGDLSGALLLYPPLIQDQTRVLGPDHPDTLTSRNNMACFRGNSGDAAGAQSAFEALLSDQERVLGPDHPDALRSRNNIANFKGVAGDYAGARMDFELLLQDQERILSKDHPDKLRTRNNIATYQGQCGDVAGALDALDAVFEDLQRVFGSDHPDTKRTLQNIEYFQSILNNADK